MEKLKQKWNFNIQDLDDNLTDSINKINEIIDEVNAFKGYFETLGVLEKPQDIDEKLEKILESYKSGLSGNERGSIVYYNKDEAIKQIKSLFK